MRVIAMVFATCCAAFPQLAWATFSIAACDNSGACGVAAATNNLAVGATVIYAQAKVGALATQYETNPSYGPKGLALLAAGKRPAAVIRALLDGDGGFDGTSVEARQVGIVDAAGEAAVYTGTEAAQSAWSGANAGQGYSVQGNGLASAQVLAAMQNAYTASTGALAERLMTALEAGQDAGGQRIGKLSAALLVRTPDGDFQDFDLRVDAAAEPITELRHLLDRRYAHQAMLSAERYAAKGQAAEANAALAEALRRSWQWDRIWRRAARLAMTLGQPDRALDYLDVFASINPVWAKQEMQDALYQPLRTNPRFVAWTTRPAGKRSTD